MSAPPRVVILGAGPAGLTAAYALVKKGAAPVVLEADPEYVGGISRTIRYKGFFFDIGGHRFFSKSKVVEDLWTEILPDDFIHRPRKSRIYYRRRFFSYPLKAFEALFNLGMLESVRCVLSYGAARLRPIRPVRSFEDWVVNQFGRRLFEIFFKTYTEKVWGMSCKEISADWAAQRIKGLSLLRAVLHAVLPRREPKDRSQVVKTLIDSFRYPRLGPGQMWEAARDRVRAAGGRVLLGHVAVGLSRNEATGVWTVRARTASGEDSVFEADHVISSVPMRELFAGLEPPPSPEAARAAAALRYRDFLTVSLILKERDAFDDNWIYIHEPGVRVGRVQNFKSWSPEMVPDPSLNCYGMEYFCFEGDGLWESTDEELVALATRELEELGLCRAGDVVDGTVVRQKKAYPVYDDGYAERVDLLRREIEARYAGLWLVGRNGMHKYNNQDHAMMTALLTVENIVEGRAHYDTWLVNQDAEYHEAGEQGASTSLDGLRSVPRRVGDA
jgi:protoporphyrinogen oxidase